MRIPTAKLIAPLAIVASALLVAVLLVTAGARVETRAPEAVARLIRSTVVKPQPHTLRVLAQGSVEPRTESDLVAEVSGRIIETAPSFAAGGFFDAGEVLVRLDPRDQELARTRAAANRDAARSRLDLAEKTFARSEALRDTGALSAREFDDASNGVQLARASFAEAEAGHAQADRDLERTEIRAPYAGRIRSTDVDVGEFVARGKPLGRIYSTDYAEIRLPIPDTDLAFLDLGIDDTAGPPVDIHTVFAGQQMHWRGKIVRTEGEINPRTRMVTIVARVEDPYGRKPGNRHPTLAVGMFVDANVRGRTIDAAIELPRSAVRDGNQVLVVDQEERIRFRTVDVVRRTGDKILIRGGLEAGESVCVSPLRAATDGMKVRTAPAT